jgi:AcrR family transcriptional regulator
VGLVAQQVNEAVARAIRTVVGPLPKAAARRLAIADSRYLSSLVRPAAPGRPSERVAASGAAGSTVPVRFAALVAWLTAAIPGAWLLARRLSRRRRRGRAPGGLPWVPLSHAGAAATGLALWVAFLLTGSPFVGWLDVAITWLIAGLGMASLLAGPTGQDATAMSAGSVASTGAVASTGTVTVTSTGAVTLATAAGRAPVLTIALHGALAVTTMVLVLLAVLSVG